MKKLLLTTYALLVAMPALAGDSSNEWTSQEIESGVKVSELTRYVKAGQSISQGFGFYLADCTLTENSVPTIVKQPEHGTVTIEMQARYTNFGKDAPSPYAKCNEKKLKTPVMTYKAEDGYAGTDTFEMTAYHSNGMMRQWNFTIEITNGKRQPVATR